MSIFEFDDQQGVRTRGTLRAPGATPGDVLTVGTSRGTVTPSPGGGAMPVNGVNILRIPQTITAAEVAAAWDTGVAIIPLTEYVPVEGDTVLWVRLRRLVKFEGGANDFFAAIDSVGGVGGPDMPTWDLSQPDTVTSGWWSTATGADNLTNAYGFAHQDAAAEPVGLTAVIYSTSTGAAPATGEVVLEFLIARAPA